MIRIVAISQTYSIEDSEAGVTNAIVVERNDGTTFLLSVLEEDLGEFIEFVEGTEVCPPDLGVSVSSVSQDMDTYDEDGAVFQGSPIQAEAEGCPQL